MIQITQSFKLMFRSLLYLTISPPFLQIQLILDQYNLTKKIPPLKKHSEEGEVLEDYHFFVFIFLTLPYEPDG